MNKNVDKLLSEISMVALKRADCTFLVRYPNPSSSSVHYFRDQSVTFRLKNFTQFFFGVRDGWGCMDELFASGKERLFF